MKQKQRSNHGGDNTNGLHTVDLGVASNNIYHPKLAPTGDIAWMRSSDIYTVDIAAMKLHHNALQTIVTSLVTMTSQSNDITNGSATEAVSCTFYAEDTANYCLQIEKGGRMMLNDK